MGPIMNESFEAFMTQVERIVRDRGSDGATVAQVATGLTGDRSRTGNSRGKGIARACLHSLVERGLVDRVDGSTPARYVAVARDET